MTADTSVRGLKSSDATPLAKLSRMLRSMLRRYPRAHLLNTLGAFGVSLDDRTYMQVSYSGSWSAEDMRDCLALFATWCVADPARILELREPLGGVLRAVTVESVSSAGRQD